MKKKYNLNDPEEVKRAEKEIALENIRILRETYNPREEILEQMIFSKKFKIPFDYLDTLDFLVYEVDFRYAQILYDTLEKKAEKEAEARANPSQKKNPLGGVNPSERAKQVMSVIDSDNPNSIDIMNLANRNHLE